MGTLRFTFHSHVESHVETDDQIQRFLADTDPALVGLCLDTGHFRYGGADSAAILDDITLDVSPNRKIAIVGRSGSGKTTLIKCLAGLLEPTSGTIYYDGVDLRSLNYRDLRRKIGFVLQENHLFNDTIARNIAFGDAEPDTLAERRNEHGEHSGQAPGVVAEVLGDVRGGVAVEAQTGLLGLGPHPGDPVVGA